MLRRDRPLIFGTFADMSAGFAQRLAEVPLLEGRCQFGQLVRQGPAQVHPEMDAGSVRSVPTSAGRFFGE